MIINIALYRCKFLYCNVQVNVKYHIWSCQDSQNLQNNASSHLPNHYLCTMYLFLQYETPLFRIYLFRMRRLIHTPSMSCFKIKSFEAWKERGLAFYTGTSCLIWYCTQSLSYLLIIIFWKWFKILLHNVMVINMYESQEVLMDNTGLN